MARNYNPTGIPIYKAAGSSRPVREELAAIGTGFVGVEAEIDLKVDAADAALTGVPTAPTAVQTTNTNQIATTAFVLGQAGTNSPLMDSSAAAGVSTYYSRQDHVHPSDTAKLDTATAASTYAPLNSPALTGNPTAPTATYGDNDTSIANTAFVTAAINGLIDAAPGTLDTLNEIAAALGDDPNFAATMTQELALKAPLASPTFSGVPTVPTAAADTNTLQAASTAFVLGQAGTTDPVQDDTTTAVGTSLKYARADHRHPINPVIASSVETCNTKALEAANSASTASTAAGNAVTAYDNFDDRYLGAKAADPSVDNDGDALITGALYFNTGANEMRVWSGAAWAAAYIPSSSYATLTGAETLTNKTIAYANNTITGVLAQGKHTIWIPAAAMTPSTTNGAGSSKTETTTNKNMINTLDFDTATQEFAQFDIGMPKSWDEGTVTFQACWTAASGSGGVVFALQGVATSNDDSMDAAFGTEQTVTDTFIAANDCHWSPESTAIPIGGTPAALDRVNFRIKRNVSSGSDTLGVDAKLIGIRLYYNVSEANDA